MMNQGLTSKSSYNEAGTDQRTGFYIGVTCPGCGGKLELENDFSILTCTHCDSILRVVMPDRPPAFLALPKMNHLELKFHLDRYLKQQQLPLTNSSLAFKRLLYPYWKTDAILLRVRNKVYERMVGEDTEYSRAEMIKQEKREISLSPYGHTLPAAQLVEGIPVSLGLRNEYLKVVPYAPENIPGEYDSLPVITSWAEALTQVDKSVNYMSHLSVPEFGRNVTELYQPRGSIVYFPFIIAECYGKDHYQRFTVDCVTGRILDFHTEPPPLDQDHLAQPLQLEYGELDIAFHRCSECGDDLKPIKSYVSICDNCQYINFSETRPSHFEGVFYAEMDRSPEIEYFPFWSFRLPPDTAGEIRQLFGGIFKSDWLTLPAFKNRHFESMYRLSKRASSALPQINLSSELPERLERFHPVTVSPQQAGMLSEVVIRRRQLRDSSSSRPELSLDTTNLESRLVYLPFRPEQYFYVDALIEGITFERSALA